MRFLADENMPGPAVHLLPESGLDVAWIRDDQPGLSDEGVLARSQGEDRVLITFERILESWPAAMAYLPPVGSFSFASKRITLSKPLNRF